MNSRRRLAGSIVLAATCGVLHAQPYDISWWTVDGGGIGGLTGGTYSLSATSGQPDAGGAMTGGPYTVTGGFWRAEVPAGGSEADLLLTMTDSPDPVTGLQTLTYTVAVSNAGPDAATALTVADALPPGVVFQSATGSGWSCLEVGGLVTCTRASLGVGAAPDISIVVTAPPTAQTLSNSASVTAAESDPDPSNNAETEPTTVTAAPATDLAIVKSDGGATAEWGQPLTYSIVATNNGPAAVTGALVSDAFPASLSSVTWTCTATAGSSCTAGGSGNIDHAVNLVSGGIATFTATGTVLPGTASPILNTATIAAPSGIYDPVPGNDASTETTVVSADDLIFLDGFDAGNVGAWSSTSGSGLAVSAAARYYDGFGLQADLAGTTPQLVQDDTPGSEKRYRARFYGRFNSLTMGDGDELELFTGFAGAGVAQLKVLVEGSGGEKRLRIAARVDGGSFVETLPGDEIPLPDGWRSVEIDWKASSAPGANDGSLDVWVDNHPQPGLLGLDNDLAAIDFVRWGAVLGIDAGTSGSFRLDEFESRRQTKIGLISLFADVPPGNLFWAWIQALYNAEVTAGCGGGNYCPVGNVTRAQMAVFLLKAKEGGDYAPPPCTADPFADVPASSPFCPWIQELVNRGVTAGCGGGNYCPSNPTTRAQMAVFLLKTAEGPAYMPPACSSDPFLDVPAGSPFCPWIQELVVRGITAGCGLDHYCPNNAVNRAQMAVFLSRTFSLPVPLP